MRPVHHRLAGRVRAHVFLCMLAYYVVWHMRQARRKGVATGATAGLGPEIRQNYVRPRIRASKELPGRRVCLFLPGLDLVGVDGVTRFGKPGILRGDL